MAHRLERLGAEVADRAVLRVMCVLAQPGGALAGGLDEAPGPGFGPLAELFDPGNGLVAGLLHREGPVQCIERCQRAVLQQRAASPP